MLNDRRYCFRGLTKGLDGRLLWPLATEGFTTAFALMVLNRSFGRGTPKPDVEGLFADCGLRSCGGDSLKHSSRDMELIEVELDNLLAPAPKRKEGN
jgi:hypothetical protein